MTEKDTQEQSEEKAPKLQKLEVSVTDEKMEDTIDPPEAQESPQSSPIDRTSWCKGLIVFITNKTFLVSTVAVIFGGIVFLYFIPSPTPPSQQGDMDPPATGRIVYLISSSIGHGHHVDMKITLPFKDTREKKALLKKLAKVKHELPSASRKPEMSLSVKKRDLDTLRQHAIKIVSTVTGVPKQKIRLEIQSLD